MHNTVIILVILVVVGFQVYVAYTVWKKIGLYKQTIPEAQNFETIKVYIAESQIKNIDINYVLNNTEKFNSSSVFVQEEIVEAAKIIQELPVNHTTTQIDEIGYEDYIWITKDNEEKKIKYKLLRSHELAGWSRI